MNATWKQVHSGTEQDVTMYWWHLALSKEEIALVEHAHTRLLDDIKHLRILLSDQKETLCPNSNR